MVPRHLNAFVMVTEVVEVQPELSVFFGADDVTKLIYKTRPAVRREAHDLAFIAVMWKPEKLSRSRVDDAGGMWVLNVTQYVDRVSFAGRPHRGDEVSESIDRKQCCLLERRYEKAAREMCAMMFDVVKTCSQLFLRNAETACKFVLHITDFGSVAESIFNLLKARMRSGEQDLLVQVR